jgi:hypothetical protein
LDTVLESSDKTNVSVEMENIQEVFSCPVVELDAKNVDVIRDEGSDEQNELFMLRKQELMNVDSNINISVVRSHFSGIKDCSIGVHSAKVAMNIASVIIDQKNDKKVSSVTVVQRNLCMEKLEKLRKHRVVLKCDNTSLNSFPKVRIVADGVHASYYLYKDSVESLQCWNAADNSCHTEDIQEKEELTSLLSHNNDKKSFMMSLDSNDLSRNDSVININKNFDNSIVPMQIGSGIGIENNKNYRV